MIIYILILFTTNCFCQSYSVVDEKIRNYPNFETLNHLSIRIQNDFNTDENRVRAAFTWIAYNMEYKKPLGQIFKPRKQIIYYSEFVKIQQIKKYELNQVNEAFKNKQGVCIEYSRILYELCAQFGIKTKVITGIFKADIKNIKGERLYKDHAWNAVLLDGEWKLLDVTSASGYFNSSSNRFEKKFTDYYFFTAPSELIKTHFPLNKSWQLSEQPVSLEMFYNAPIFHTEYFIKNVKLNKNTKGLIFVSPKNEFVISFASLPKNKRIYYQIKNNTQLKRARFKKNKNKSYSSKMRFGKQLKNNDYVTLFLENKAILNFKVQKENQ